MRAHTPTIIGARLFRFVLATGTAHSDIDVQHRLLAETDVWSLLLLLVRGGGAGGP